MDAYRRCGGNTSRILTLVLDGSVIRFMLRLIYPQGKDSCTLYVPWSQPGLAKRKVLLSARIGKPIVHPVTSLITYLWFV
jgi:hypothetical protein